MIRALWRRGPAPLPGCQAEACRSEREECDGSRLWGREKETTDFAIRKRGGVNVQIRRSILNVGNERRFCARGGSTGRRDKGGIPSGSIRHVEGVDVMARSCPKREPGEGWSLRGDTGRAARDRNRSVDV